MTRKLLSIDTNAKTVKGQKLGFMTGILYLAPADLSGRNVCPTAELAGCKQACLNTAGRGAFNSVQQARLSKTEWFFADRQAFMLALVADVKRLVRKAERAGMVPLVRLNGTSDIRWESEPVTIGNVVYPNIMTLFPDVQFYDYTKLSNRRNVPANYDLTFSYSGTAGYQRFVREAVEAGMRIAVVFRKREEIPATFIGLPTVDGDDSDVRHLDPKGAVVALYAKGKARKDTSGFVVDTDVQYRKVIMLSVSA